MHYYNIALEGKNLTPLTYESPTPYPPLSRLRVTVKNRPQYGYLWEEISKPSYPCVEIPNQTPQILPLIYRKSVTFLSEYYFCEVGELLGMFHPLPQTSLLPMHIDTQITLSPAQSKALDFTKKHPISLLFGDTGCGKTEIYMKRFEEVINEGGTALFLMPEIALTPQIEKRLKAHFGSAIGIWHSKIKKQGKQKILEGIAKGEIRILAGARSALFVPLPSLSLIVVDEEHDDSYKSSSRPRYHARDTAVLLSTHLSIPVILGSATPSLTSWHRFPTHRLRGQYFSAKKRYHLIHSVNELPESKTHTLLQTQLNEKRQSILFLPTRANFKYLTCQSCGKSVECPYCSVGMSVHHHQHLIKCHYCDYREPIPTHCPECKLPTLSTHRVGTSELTAHLQEHFSNARIEIFDRDHISTEKQLKALLSRFNDHEIDILVGTQMLSKGHNYHEVTLAVILGIDYLLAQADYRAAEKALALLLQTAGRAGRKQDADVVIQSIHREFFGPYLEDYEHFLKKESPLRKGLYPPYKRLARVLFSHKDRDKALVELDIMNERLSHCEGIEIVGVGSCAVERIAGKYRFQILLRSDSAKALIHALRGARTPLAEIDMDPVQFS